MLYASILITVYRCLPVCIWLSVLYANKQYVYVLTERQRLTFVILLTCSHGYTARAHAQLSLRSWINVVTGKMIGIDRASKHVLVTGGRRVPYDHLILCTGEQYQVTDIISY